MNSPLKSIEQKLNVLKLAENLGNVSKACRLVGVSRTQYYEYKKRYKSSGIEGLIKPFSKRKNDARTISGQIEERVMELSILHPMMGCAKLSTMLGAENISISPVTVHNILTRRGISTRKARALRLEENVLQDRIELSSEQIEFLERVNPCYRERYMQGRRPCEFLVHDILLLGKFENLGRLYLQLIVDTCTLLGFGSICTTRSPSHAINILDDVVLPFFHSYGLLPDTVVTSSSAVFCGNSTHPYELYLDTIGVKHLISNTKGQRNGHIESVRHFTFREFFINCFNSKRHENIFDLNNDLQEWFLYYNGQRTSSGYPLMGLTPMNMLNNYLVSK